VTQLALPDDSPSVANRRLWLGAATVTGGAGLVATAVPFVASLAPSENARALGAPVEVDTSSLRPGELRTVEWRGKPMFVLRRTPEMIDALARHDTLLADPQSRRSLQPETARNDLRSIRPELAVIEAVRTHLGCVPTFRPTPGSRDLGAQWPGGFFCPCHGSKFDLAGRVFKNMPAPTNLTVPPYRFASDSVLPIGADASA
jgi:ubiquinol-cytochrome c reductase iron-sulfur subunit